MIFGLTLRGRHLLLYDIAATGLAVILGFAIRFEANDILATMAPYLPVALLPLLVNPPVFAAFGLYRREWRYASVRELYAIAAGVFVASAISFAFLVGLALLDAPGSTGFPRSVFFIEALLTAALVGGGRFLLRTSLERRGPMSDAGSQEPLVTLVYGAGEAGATITRLADRDPEAGIAVVGFIDDDPRKRGSRLMGRKVLGGLSDLGVAVSRTGAETLLIAMPSADGPGIRRALKAGQELGLQVRTVPPLRELVSGVQLSKIRPVSVEDLLRREPVEIDMDVVAGYLNGASVMVTGGGGSIGSELARQILVLGPRALTIVDNHEWTLWSVDRELDEQAGAGTGVQIKSILADIRSSQATEAMVRQVKPDVVFHAAALKHVPIVERFPSEGVLTNVVGTRNMLRACESGGVGRFVLISTDKAVEPSSVMGATKRIAEHLAIATGSHIGAPYSAVRFGNVLGSSGSVLPIFAQQLERGLPITITHPDATRYFMTIPEAVSLILEAGATQELGQVLVLDMGEPIRIIDLARDLIRLRGQNPDTVDFVYTGLRPGERLHEALFYGSETAERTEHPGILRAQPDAASLPRDELSSFVDLLEAAARDGDDHAVRSLLRERSYLVMPHSEFATAPT